MNNYGNLFQKTKYTSYSLMDFEEIIKNDQKYNPEMIRTI